MVILLLPITASRNNELVGGVEPTPSLPPPRIGKEGMRKDRLQITRYMRMVTQLWLFEFPIRCGISKAVSQNLRNRADQPP